MFRGIKLWFTDRNYYYQRKRYVKLQKEYRKKLTKQAKEFCPWSGYYMHEMIKTMLEFYHKTYLAGDCCWSEEGRIEEIATSLGVTKHWADELDKLDNLCDKELLEIAQTSLGVAFDKYVAAYEDKIALKISESNHKDILLSSLAQEFLTEKYTQALYNSIGKHIWEWCD
jgi:hypothetical protein